MKSNELRVGNWVNAKGITQQLWVVGENAYYGEESGNGLHDYQIEPIPLTEEWLFRFGAALWEDTPHQRIYKVGRLLFGITKGVQGVDLIFDRGSVNRVPIIYVHHFQNICLDLDGNELELDQA